MAYTPINWQTGDIITAEKLNKMDRGWGVENTQLFSETVTTVDSGSGFYSAGLTYSQFIDSDTLIVTFNGTDYSCNRIVLSGSHYYGGFSESGPDFSVYPFVIESTPIGNTIYTETAETYTVSTSGETLICGDSFISAVQSVTGVFYILATWDETASGYILDKTTSQIKAAYNNGQLCRIVASDNSFTTDVIPFEMGIALTPYVRVNTIQNLLISNSFSLDQQTGVLTVDEELYTITPTP